MIRYDDRHYPILLSCWRGPYGKEELNEAFAFQRQLAQRAKRDGLWLASITIEGDTPTSAERKLIADYTREMPADLRDRTIVSIAVIESPVKRGVLTALGWLISDLSTIEAVGTQAEALASARRALVTKGVPFPESLDLGELRRVLDRLSSDARAKTG